MQDLQDKTQLTSSRRQVLSKNKSPAPVIWLMGLSGSGKTTLGLRLLDHLRGEIDQVEFIDGDWTREFFGDNFDYSRENRIANIKRIIFGAMLLSKNGILTIVSNISPYAETRAFARAKLPKYCEIYLNASVDECARRDVKGLYAKARQGKIPNVIGVHEPYETPSNPDLIVDTQSQSFDQSFAAVFRFLQEKKVL